MRLCFLRDINDRVQWEAKEAPDSDLLKELESKAQLVFDKNWSKRIEPIFLDDIRKKCYDYSLVRDLLRVIRNKWTHYSELPKELRYSLFLWNCW